MHRFILFDIDLTLVRTLGAGREAVDIAFDHVFGIKDASAGWAFDGKTDYHSFRALLERHGVAGTDLDLTYQRLVGGYLTAFPSTMATKGGLVFPGVIALLDALEARYGALGLATGNVERGAALKLGRFGLWERFSGGGFGEWTADRADLVLDGVTALARILGQEPDTTRAVVFGDTPHDVQSAVRLGGRGIGVATGRYSVEELLAAGASAAFPDLTHLDAILAAVEG